MSAITLQYLLNEVRKLQRQVEKLHKMLDAHLAAHYARRIDSMPVGELLEPEEDNVR